MPLRKVHFYRLSAGTDDAGRPMAVGVEPIFRHVNRLPFDDAGRHLADDDGNVTCCWVDRGAHPSRVALGTVRRVNLPQMERRGLLEPLPIPDGSGIVEQTHFVFFRNGIVGSLFNFYGPRVGKLRLYMLDKAPMETPDRIRFELLLRQDVLDQLDRLEGVRVIELSVRRAFIDSVEQADHTLGAAFRSAAEAGDAEQVEIVLKPRRYAREWLGARMLGFVQQLARREHLQEEVAKFKVKGLDPETQRLENIDVLRDQLAVEVEVDVVEGAIRAVVPQSAYAGIVRAYESVRAELLRAAGIR